MTSEEKISFVKKMVIEKAEISPKGSFFVELVSVIDTEVTGGIPDGAPVVLSRSDQWSIIKKLEEEGFVQNIRLDSEEWIAWLEMPAIRTGDQERLKFYSNTGEISYKNKLSEVKLGSKGYALLNILNNSKNTPFNIEEVRDYCNPSVKNPKYLFEAEKDIDDTLRLIRLKLKVQKQAFFPIEKKGSGNNKKWIWIEK